MKIIHVRFPPGAAGPQVLKRVYDSGTSLSIIPLRQGTRWDVSLLVKDELLQRLLDELRRSPSGTRVSVMRASVHSRSSLRVTPMARSPNWTTRGPFPDL